MLQRQRFRSILNDTNLDSRQIYFVNQIVEYIVHNGLLKDLSCSSGTTFYGPGQYCGHIYRSYMYGLGIRKTIEQVNANAA